MAGENIFIVEDEKIVAEDLKRILERLGYKIVGSEANGEKAIEQMKIVKPDLVLMDIRIQGPMDGIDVAEHVFVQYEIPVVYLTAYADDVTLDRAKSTLAAGYILKPFEERSVKTTIELALYRHKMDRMLKNADDWHGGILETLSVAVMAVDTKSNVMYMNKLAETMTGHTLDKAIGKPSKDILPPQLSRKESVIKDQEGQVKGMAFVLP
jgi:DNA-binding NarL/FixJ family response regulator